jgi:prepilin signal peptidase PulO-like enzyme (type II secretory pathway)
MGMLTPSNATNYDSFTLYIFHLILFTFLLAATLTDFYEMIIPDTITIAGTFIALCTSYLCWETALPVWTNELYYTVCSSIGGEHDDGKFITYPMDIWSPNSNIWWHVPTGTCSLAMWVFLTIFLWWFWCFAMLDRVWYAKLPFRKANAIFWRYLYRSPRTKYIIAAAVIVPPCLIRTYCTESEITLLSALVGMAAGMILIWSVRLVSRWVLGIEAMGFGDVTLMGMIGAFLGWQAVLVIFFIAPFFGLVYGIINVILGRGRAVPYGPFLCLATVFVVIFWRFVWEATAEYFAFGIGTIGIALLALLVLFAGLLHIVHKIFSGLRR